MSAVITAVMLLLLLMMMMIMMMMMCSVKRDGSITQTAAADTILLYTYCCTVDSVNHENVTSCSRL